MNDLHIYKRVIDPNIIIPFKDVFNKHIVPALFIFIFYLVNASPQNGNSSQIRPSGANIGELLRHKKASIGLFA